MSDDEVMIAEITHTQRVIVYADVAQVCAENETDRARYPNLTDFEYVSAWVAAEPYDFLTDRGLGTDGFRIDEDLDDIDVDAYSEPS